MPRFYFHLRTPAGRDNDDVGLELVGVEAAYLEACRSVPDMSAELVQAGANPARYAFDITDPGGNLLMEVPFPEVLDRGRRPTLPVCAAQLRKAEAEMARTARLISAIREEQAALHATLTETWRLLADAHKGSSSPPQRLP